MLKFFSKINGFWVGQIGELEIMSMNSFLDNGHPYHLWIYEEQKNIPNGVVLQNAEEIVPRKVYENWFSQQHKKHLKQTFANYFRYKLINKVGGFWCDLDFICLQPLDFQEDFIFCGVSDIPTRRELNIYFDKIGPYGNCVNSLFKSPPDQFFLEYMIREIEQDVIDGFCPETFGIWGAVLLTESLIKFDLLKYKKNNIIEYGINYSNRQYNDSELPLPNSYTLHFYNYLGRKDIVDNSLYDRMKKRYL